jgi:hypothetical protein
MIAAPVPDLGNAMEPANRALAPLPMLAPSVVLLLALGTLIPVVATENTGLP